MKASSRSLGPVIASAEAKGTRVMITLECAHMMTEEDRTIGLVVKQVEPKAVIATTGDKILIIQTHGDWGTSRELLERALEGLKGSIKGGRL